jgi:hypothetical protein
MHRDRTFPTKNQTSLGQILLPIPVLGLVLFMLVLLYLQWLVYKAVLEFIENIYNYIGGYQPPKRK